VKIQTGQPGKKVLYFTSLFSTLKINNSAHTPEYRNRRIHKPWYIRNIRNPGSWVSCYSV